MHTHIKLFQSQHVCYICNLFCLLLRL